MPHPRPALALLLALLALLAGAPATALDLPVDLAAAANFGLADPVAGDGRGGWSDQGPENDLAGFDIRQREFGGMAFALLDPAANGGRAVLTFDSPHARSGLTSARATLPADARVRHLYLLHTSCWNQAPRGTRIGTITVARRSGPPAELAVAAGIDVSDWWNADDGANAQVVHRRRNGSAQVGLFLSRFDLPADVLPGGELVLSGSGAAVWIVLAATASDRRLDFGGGSVTFAAGADWRAVDTSALLIQPGSALDLSATVEEGPAGRHGRAVVGPGGLAFADEPARERRLLGFNGLFWGIRPLASGDPGTLAAFAAGVRRQGYDLVRPLVTEVFLMEGATAEAVPNPAKLAVVDRLFAELKAQGVYIYLTVGAYQLGLTGKPRYQDSRLLMAQMLVGEPAMRSRWQRMAETMLAHVNPHTGLAWKDDPAFLCLEFYNEQEIGFERFDVLDPATRALYDARWRAWLERRYGTPAALAAAWGAKAPAGLAVGGWSALAMPEQARGADAVGHDAALFVRDLAREQLAWCEGVVRAAGWRGLTSQFNFSKVLHDSALRWEGSQAVSMNSYFCHPTALSRPGSQCGQGSSVAAAGQYWREAAAVRCVDRPLLITEHHHAFWNPFQHEDGLLFGAYSALQGFAAVIVHEDAVAAAPLSPVREFAVAESPVARANEFLAACLYHRGDVRRSPHRVELRVPAGFLAGSGNGSRAVNGHQSRLALLTGFGIAFPDRPPFPGGAALAAPDLVLGPAGGAEVHTGGWSTSVVEAAESPKGLAAQVATLRRAGVLSAANRSDPEAGVFESDTGEILMRADEGTLAVATAASEGLALKAGGRGDLPHLAVHSTSVPATVALCAVDGRPLAASRRLVLVYATEAANTGMVLSASRGTMRAQGRLPVLLRTGKAALTLRLEPGAPAAVHALGLDGSRRERIPAATAADGGVAIELDTGTLAGSATPFFEVVRE